MLPEKVPDSPEPGGSGGHPLNPNKGTPWSGDSWAAENDPGYRHPDPSGTAHGELWASKNPDKMEPQTPDRSSRVPHRLPSREL